LASNNGEIWSGIAKAIPSTTHNDGKLASFQVAVGALLATSHIAGSFAASDRDDDSNTFMLFVQAGVVATIIGPLGNVNVSTGHKQQSINTASASNSDLCLIEVAIATITDSVSALSNTGAAIKSLASSVKAICGGGVCPTNKDPSACTAANYLEGASILTSIDAQWSM
jgi:hypothetical protein